MRINDTEKNINSRLQSKDWFSWFGPNWVFLTYCCFFWCDEVTMNGWCWWRGVFFVSCVRDGNMYFAICHESKFPSFPSFSTTKRGVFVITALRTVNEKKHFLCNHQFDVVPSPIWAGQGLSHVEKLTTTKKLKVDRPTCVFSVLWLSQTWLWNPLH